MLHHNNHAITFANFNMIKGIISIFATLLIGASCISGCSRSKIRYLTHSGIALEGGRESIDINYRNSLGVSINAISNALGVSITKDGNALINIKVNEGTLTYVDILKTDAYGSPIEVINIYDFEKPPSEPSR
jgi:hypothetical protein